MLAPTLVYGEVSLWSQRMGRRWNSRTNGMCRSTIQKFMLNLYNPNSLDGLPFLSCTVKTLFYGRTRLLPACDDDIVIHQSLLLLKVLFYPGNSVVTCFGYWILKESIMCLLVVTSMVCNWAGKRSWDFAYISGHWCWNIGKDAACFYMLDRVGITALILICSFER